VELEHVNLDSSVKHWPADKGYNQLQQLLLQRIQKQQTSIMQK